MAQPYVGELRMFAGNFAPAGWMFCNGQLLPISENETLFQLIGTTYGGDGQSTFALPNLQSRVPIHMSAQTPIASMGGVETVALSATQIPSHTHPLVVSSGNGSQASPANNVLAASTLIRPYAADPPATSLALTAITQVGGSQPHENCQPFLCVHFIISLFGIFPSQT